MSISTRKGDTGETDLLFGCRLSKSHPRVHALGAVDELNAALGLLRVSARRGETRDWVATVQPWLITLMGELATPPGEEARYRATHPVFDAGKTDWLDERVAWLEAAGALKFQGWALPGEAGVLSGAFADHARTVCRRAERVVMDLAGTDQAVPNPEVVRFLNRLADVLWLLARWEERTDSSTLPV
jgi:cob(I)alamin adenosyltransferase